MGFFARIFGICKTRPPADGDCWNVSGGNMEIELGRAPELSEKGGAIRLEGRGLPQKVLVIHGVDGEFHAFGNKCTHMGRRIDPLPGTETVRCCSVSKSTFDYTGKVISGTAKEPLKTFAVKTEEGKVTVSL
ncbi:MAG: Rieske 2Fe-2S domain-containing protein [Deltaproteobacteria bacterium]|nr:Rieske 2Fe-2S domain-containing protein [Deltaproteobacteria bacterium]